MQRLFNLDKWTPLSEGRAMAFDTDRPRVVRLEVNSAGPCNLYVMERDHGGKDGAEALFLAHVHGRDVLEFHVGGAFALVADGDACNVYTVDGDVWSHQELAPEIFTRIHERRVRNPELEYIVAKMQSNMERRLAAQADELRLLVDRRAAASALPSAAKDDGGAASSSKGRDESHAPDPADAGKAYAGGKAKKTGTRDDEL